MSRPAVTRRARAASGAAPWQSVVTARRHEVVVDEPEKLGGGDAGPSPYDLVLGGLAACTDITLRMYAERKGWPLERVEVTITLHDPGEGEQTLDRAIVLHGVLDDEQRAALLDVSGRTPVTRTLAQAFDIRTELVPPPT